MYVLRQLENHAAFPPLDVSRVCLITVDRTLRCLSA